MWFVVSAGYKGIESDDNKELVTFQQELTEAASRNRKATCIHFVIFFSLHEGKKKKDDRNNKYKSSNLTLKSMF